MKFLFTLICLGFGSLASAQLLNFNPGDTATDFTVITTNNDTVQLYDLTSNGQFVVIDFMFTSCTPCQDKAPILDSFYHKYGCNTGDVFALRIDWGDTNADVTAFETAHGYYPYSPAASGVDGPGDTVVADYGPDTYPTMVVIDTNNVFLATDIFPLTNVADIEAAFADSTLTEMVCLLGVDEMASAIELNMYPNPANNQLNLSYQLAVSGRTTITIFNLLGEVVMHQDLGMNSTNLQNHNIDIASLPQGNYMVQMSCGDAIRTEKLVVVR